MDGRRLAPKNPPPLVPTCLIGIIAATGPMTMVCCLTWPSSVVPIAPGSSVEACTVLLKVIGMPCCMKRMPHRRHTGTNM